MVKMAPKTHGYVNIHSCLGKIAVNIIKVSKAIWQGAPPIWAMLKRKGDFVEIPTLAETKIKLLSSICWRRSE